MENTVKEKNFEEFNFDSTGNPAVDMVISCVSFYRKKKAKFRAIKLREDYYDMFVEYVKKFSDVEEGQELTMDGILVEKSQYEISDALFVEFYN